MPDYTKDLRPLTANEQAIHDAIGYDPVLVSMPGGIGGLTYRTADDMDNLVAKLAPLLDAKDAEIAKADRAFNRLYEANGKLHLKVMELELR